ncbi:MAG: BlaI/MecI/CopY family transcriptional regulator [Kangiella sp.]|nr:MAG: BlaI/MecI/CopY family transcriptional regulator [Kangiella sp.]
MQISDSEKLIMDSLWNSSPKTAKQIIENLDPALNWADKTAKSLINRLLKKEAISFNKQGREYLYFPLLEREDYIENATDSFVNRVFNGSVSSLVAAFAKKEKLSEHELSELKQLIKEIEND